MLDEEHTADGTRLHARVYPGSGGRAGAVRRGGVARLRTSMIDRWSSRTRSSAPTCTPGRVADERILANWQAHAGVQWIAGKREAVMGYHLGVDLGTTFTAAAVMTTAVADHARARQPGAADPVGAVLPAGRRRAGRRGGRAAQRLDPPARCGSSSGGSATRCRSWSAARPYLGARADRPAAAAGWSTRPPSSRASRRSDWR